MHLRGARARSFANRKRFDGLGQIDRSSAARKGRSSFRESVRAT
jgi:hypothetical protein